MSEYVGGLLMPLEKLFIKALQCDNAIDAGILIGSWNDEIKEINKVLSSWTTEKERN